jgi:hypothetical protein
METIKDKNFRSLTKEETKEAKKELIRYPIVIRDDVDPPFLDQHFAVLSFKFFDPPKETERGKVYGIFKFRGARPSKKKAEKRCAEIIKTLDSANKCKILETGKWTFVSDDLHLDSVEIKEDDEFKVEKEDKKQKEQDVIKELHERTSEISKNEHMKGDKPLEQYCRNKTVSAQIHKQMNSFIQRLKRAEKEMKEEEERNPNIVNEWIPYMNDERIKVGLKEIKSEKDLID